MYRAEGNRSDMQRRHAQAEKLDMNALGPNFRNYENSRHCETLIPNFEPVHQNDAWRDKPNHKKLLTPRATKKLNEFLVEEFQVEPRLSDETHGLPVLSVRPSSLFLYILKRLLENKELNGKSYVDIYGGIANAVVASDARVEVHAPTDFDARFYIAHQNGWKEFDTCRGIVEDFLLQELNKSSPNPSVLTSEVVRDFYFQKQVVIGGFSLLSIGNTMGKVIDLEFSNNVDDGRKFFDVASAFVVPVSLKQLQVLPCASSTVSRSSMASVILQNSDPLKAYNMASPFDQALETIRRGLLSLENISEVSNGATLFAHAVSSRRLKPSDTFDEGKELVELGRRFRMDAAAATAARGDPLRFVRSFLRSHYASRPLAAYCTTAQLAAVVGPYCGNPVGAQLSNYVGGLIANLAMSAATAAAGEMTGAGLDGLWSMAAVAAFLRDPFSDAGVDAADRSEDVNVDGGRLARLLRIAPLPPNCPCMCTGMFHLTNAAFYLKGHLASTQASMTSATDDEAMQHCLLAATVSVLEEPEESILERIRVSSANKQGNSRRHRDDEHQQSESSTFSPGESAVGRQWRVLKHFRASSFAVRVVYLLASFRPVRALELIDQLCSDDSPNESVQDPKLVPEDANTLARFREDMQSQVRASTPCNGAKSVKEMEEDDSGPEDENNEDEPKSGARVAETSPATQNSQPSCTVGPTRGVSDSAASGGVGVVESFERLSDRSTLERSSSDCGSGSGEAEEAEQIEVSFGRQGCETANDFNEGDDAEDKVEVSANEGDIKMGPQDHLISGGESVFRSHVLLDSMDFEDPSAVPPDVTGTTRRRDARRSFEAGGLGEGEGEGIHRRQVDILGVEPPLRPDDEMIDHGAGGPMHAALGGIRKPVRGPCGSGREGKREQSRPASHTVQSVT